MSPWEMALWMLVVLLAVLIGVLIPVLMQLRSSMRSWQGLADRLAPKLEGTLGEVQAAAQKLNAVGGELETGARNARALWKKTRNQPLIAIVTPPSSTSSRSLRSSGHSLHGSYLPISQTRRSACFPI